MSSLSARSAGSEASPLLTSSIAFLVLSTSIRMSPALASDSLLTLARYFLAVSLVRPHLSATS